MASKLENIGAEIKKIIEDIDYFKSVILGFPFPEYFTPEKLPGVGIWFERAENINGRLNIDFSIFVIIYEDDHTQAFNKVSDAISKLWNSLIYCKFDYAPFNLDIKSVSFQDVFERLDVNISLEPPYYAARIDISVMAGGLTM